MYQYNNRLIAGLYNETDYQKWLSDNMPKTGKILVRKVDSVRMGEIVYLGMDWSLVWLGWATEPRQDKAEYYEEADADETGN